MLEAKLTARISDLYSIVEKVAAVGGGRQSHIMSEALAELNEIDAHLARRKAEEQEAENLPRPSPQQPLSDAKMIPSTPIKGEVKDGNPKEEDLTDPVEPVAGIDPQVGVDPNQSNFNYDKDSEVGGITGGPTVVRKL